MKAPVWPLIIALIFPFNISFAQTSGKSIKIDGYGYSLAVNKNKQLAISTCNGEVAFANSVDGSWRKTFVDAYVNGEHNIIGNTCYFNADTAFVWGDMYTFAGRNDKVYHTVNRGKSWRPVKLGFEGRINDAVFLDNGEAWLIVEDVDIAYTKDYGFTWTRLTIPGGKNRFARIFFNNKRAGIIGSPWNVLAYTSDNCKHWTKITTPYSQEKDKKINVNIGPEIRRVAIFKDYLLVRQGNLVFYSKIDTVQWLLLPGYKDFYTDAESKALFFERNNGGFVKSDSSLKPVFSFESIRDPYSAISKNGSLYVLGRGKLWQINTRNQLVESRVNFIAASKPVKLGYAGGYGKLIAHIGNKIYQQKDDKWLYAFTLPFATDSGFLYMKDGSTIMFSRYDSIFYYHIESGKVDKGNRKEWIGNFGASGIQKIIFERGSQGCYGGHEEELVYEHQNTQFVQAKSSNMSNDQYKMLRDYPDTIDQRIVEEFIKKIPAIYTKQVSIDDLDFSQEEYDICKRNILKYKSLFEGEPKEGEYPFTFDINPDFTKLITLVDSVKTINQELLNCFFFRQKNWSTVRHWVKITIVNKSGDVLEIESPDFFLFTFYIPWQMRLNGSYSVNTAIEINRFIKNVYPGFLGKKNSVDMIQELVKLLYLEEE